jgi:hypothetical protein
MNSFLESSGRNILIAAIALAAALLLNAPVQAQGFMVKPMRLEVSAAPGQTVQVPLEIRNTAGSAVREIDLRLAELSQTPNGSWMMVEANSGEDTSKLMSTLPWTSIADDRLEIAPLQPAETMVRFDVPVDARGAYFAAIVAEQPVPEDANGIVVRVRFVIPVIVLIEGRTVRQQVALDDVVMTYHDGTDGERATTTAALLISNKGRTYSRVQGQLRVERLNDGRWKPVTLLDIDERAIIPGKTLELGQDLGRRLPSGTYRLRGDLQVDGRRVEPIEKEIEFAGDPNVDTFAYDAALILEPEMVEMEIAPGATRTTTLRIENPGADPVKVQMASSTPRALMGVALGELEGVEISAEPWTEIRPAEFTIRPGRTQNVRVISRIPREGIQHPNYYADLILRGEYADGQSAGETRSTVHLANAEVASTLHGAVEQLSLAEGGDPAKFVVQVRFANLGNVHVEPSARAFLLEAQGGQVRNVPLLGEEGSLLPLSKRSYSAEMDFADLEPGYYALRSVVTLASGKDVAHQEVVLVDTQELTGEDGTTVSVPRVAIIDPQAAALPEGVEFPADDVPVDPLDGESDASDPEASGPDRS